VLTSVLLLSSAGIVLGLGCLWAVHLWYRIKLDRYEQLLQKTYVSHFEHRATEALQLHARLGKALARSKAILELVREATPEAAITGAALQEVSELLEDMAVESDRAVRELEDEHAARRETHSSHDG
jgi:hypothetical protein